nr:hypothetical protein CFP56_64459 [Quercus suber]
MASMRLKWTQEEINCETGMDLALCSSMRPTRLWQAPRGCGGLGLGLGLGLHRSLGMGLDLGSGWSGQKERERERHEDGWAGGDRQWGGGAGLDGRRGRSSSSHDVCLVIVGEG